jgi:hypothetical protein
MNNEAHDNLRKLYLELYKIFRSEINSNTSFLYQHFQRYLTLITALLFASVLCVWRSEGGEGAPILGKIAVFLSFMNIVVCYIGYGMCNSFYKGVLEMVAASAKMEGLLGLLDNRQSGNHPVAAFPDDQFVMPDRWLREREQHRTSESFIKDRLSKGSNYYVRLTFLILGLANAAFMAFIIGYLLSKQ